MNALSHLPRLEKEDLIDTWDDSRDACCGYLNKKAGKGSTFSTGKWQKRWFVLKIHISGHDNYSLSYYHSPEEKTPRQQYKLDGATLTVTSGANTSNSFQLICSNGSHVMIGCESRDTMSKWILSLETAIRVAGERGKIQRERWGSGSGGVGIQPQISGIKSVNSDVGSDHEDLVEQDRPDSLNDDTREHKSTPVNVVKSSDFANPFSTASSTTPAVRLNADINTIPPGSTQRNEFEEMFRNDIARTLGIGIDLIDVLNIHPSPGMDWLTIVEFDIFIDVNHLGLSQYEIEELEEDAALQAEVDMQCREKRNNLLTELFACVKDNSSVLYNGFITCNIDPSFSQGLHAVMLENDEDYEIYSSDPNVQRIMEKYQNVHVPSDVPNLSHFKIFLSFGDKTRPIMVPNPLILSKSKCFLWPYEVKRGIGMMDNMQELWIEPIALVPIGLPKSLSEPIYFTNSARCNGNVVIHASKLKADLCYEVLCEDNRMEVLNILTEEEKSIIKDNFDRYDRDNSGIISKHELDNFIRNRTAERKEIIDKQFEAVVAENHSDESFLKAEEMRRMQYQQLGEAQNKLLRMFENCDIDGDGGVNFAEFLLAEAWWLRCTLNPEQASLF